MLVAASEEIQFGLIDSFRSKQSKLAATLHDLMQRISESLEKSSNLPMPTTAGLLHQQVNNCCSRPNRRDL
jgi:hypothetical protein